MFRFLFKRSSKPVSSPAPEASPAPSRDRNQEKAAAIAQASYLAGQEHAAADFVLNCPFAEARFIAAQTIQAPELLEQVGRAMRDTDRRVARLMQTRLDEINHRLKCADRALERLNKATELAQQARLFASDVTELDRSWQGLVDVPDDTREAFDAVRENVSARLLAQTALQRQLIDMNDRLRFLADHLSSGNESAVDASSLDAISRAIDACRHAAEAPSLPQSLLSTCDAALDHCRSTLVVAEQRSAARIAREAILSTWEQAEPSLLEPAVLKRQWDALPASGEDALQQRFVALLDSAAAARHRVVAAAFPIGTGKRKETRQNSPAFEDALSALENALDRGVFQEALAQDRLLRSLGSVAAAGSQPLAARLSAARARLASLQGWARWGGAVSREELLKGAQGLPSQERDPQALADRVGDLRRSWKALDGSAGPAQRDIWEQFDAACTQAYAPAAEHFAKLAAEREANLAQAEKLIAEIDVFAASCGFTATVTDPDNKDVDWKEVGRVYSRVREAWQRLGPIGRRERKQLQARFDTALSELRGPLLREQQRAAERQEVLIADVLAIDPFSRDAMNHLRAVQQHWQEEARTLPLPRNNEQMLWQRFRGVCDAMLVQRREGHESADETRRRNLENRQALCAKLESAAAEPQEHIPFLLTEAAEAWRNAGEVPRGAHDEIEARYRNAVAALRRRTDSAAQIRIAERWTALRERLALCRQAEQALLDDLPRAQNVAAWDQLPTLPPRLQQALQLRFDKAARDGEDCRSHRAMLQANRDAMLQEILRFEILAGVDSPSTLSRERLQLQVEVLQSAMKAGREGTTLAAQLARVCGLAAAMDDDSQQRIDKALVAVQEREPAMLDLA
jgi:exonuclease SbcC